MTTDQIISMAKQALDISKTNKINRNMYIYDQTNEDLATLFSIYNFKDKDVLCVLASSDQLLSCYYQGARSVDTFDKVYLSFFYYYLRRWNLENNNSIYPDSNLYYDGDKKIYEMIKSVVPINKEEYNAKLFWLLYLENNGYKLSPSLCERAIASFDKPFANNQQDIDILKKRLSENIFFKWMDLFHPTGNVKKKYDVLILSNMLEYAKNIKQLINARDNIESFLKDDGIAICSYKRNQNNSPRHLHEERILSKNNLEIDGSYLYYEPLYGKRMDLAYSYIKRKK